MAMGRSLAKKYNTNRDEIVQYLSKIKERNNIEPLTMLQYLDAVEYFIKKKTIAETAKARNVTSPSVVYNLEQVIKKLIKKTQFILTCSGCGRSGTMKRFRVADNKIKCQCGYSEYIGQ